MSAPKGEAIPFKVKVAGVVPANYRGRTAKERLKKVE